MRNVHKTFELTTVFSSTAQVGNSFSTLP